MWSECSQNERSKLVWLFDNRLWRELRVSLIYHYNWLDPIGWEKSVSQSFEVIGGHWTGLRSIQQGHFRWFGGFATDGRIDGWDGWLSMVVGSLRAPSVLKMRVGRERKSACWLDGLVSVGHKILWHILLKQTRKGKEIFIVTWWFGQRWSPRGRR